MLMLMLTLMSAQQRSDKLGIVQLHGHALQTDPFSPFQPPSSFLNLVLSLLSHGMMIMMMMMLLTFLRSLGSLVLVGEQHGLPETNQSCPSPFLSTTRRLASRSQQ